MTAPAILLAPDPETHEHIVALETLAKLKPKTYFGADSLLLVLAELRNARMAAHLIEAGLQRCEVENDELAEQLKREKSMMRRMLIQGLITHPLPWQLEVDWDASVESASGRVYAGEQAECEAIIAQAVAIERQLADPEPPQDSAEPPHAGEPGRAAEVEA